MAGLRQVYRRSGPEGVYPKCLKLSSEDLPALRSAEVLVKVHAVSLNYRDINILRGTNPWAMKDGGVPTSDAAGEVVAVRVEVQELQLGDRVTPIFDQNNLTGDEQDRSWLGGEIDGVLASHIVFSESRLVKIPDHLSYAEASLLPCAGLTAWNALNLPVSLTGQTILLQGTGGVSLLALKLAYLAGSRIVITSSSSSKLEMLKERYPGIETINYRSTPEWHEETLRLTDRVGADLIVENGGSSTLIQSLKATKRHGVISSVGYLGVAKLGDLDELIALLIDRAITLKGINVGSKRELVQLYRLVGAKKVALDDLIDARFSFEDAVKAFEYLAEGRHTGKVVIDVA